MNNKEFDVGLLAGLCLFYQNLLNETIGQEKRVAISNGFIQGFYKTDDKTVPNFLKRKVKSKNETKKEKK